MLELCDMVSMCYELFSRVWVMIFQCGSMKVLESWMIVMDCGCVINLVVF